MKISDKEILEKLIEINNERNISVGLFESGKSGVMVLEIEIEIQETKENEELFYKHLQEQF